MKHKDFYDEQHANQYLTHSVVRVGGYPVYVTSVRETRDGMHLYYCKLGDTDDVFTINLKDDAVDLSPVPLGYVNLLRSDDGAPLGVVHTVSRFPSRTWKVGLSIRNMKIAPSYRMGPIMIGRERMLTSKSLALTIMNQYLSCAAVMHKLHQADNENMIAFDRKFAIFHRTNRSRLFYYKVDVPVGDFNGDEPVLYDEYSYLKESLAIALGKA